MRFETQSTKCPACKGPLTLVSHIRRWAEPREVHEFEFRCDTCKHDYMHKEGELTSKTHERDRIAENQGITKKVHHEDVVNVFGWFQVEAFKPEHQFAVELPRVDGPLDYFL